MIIDHMHYHLIITMVMFVILIITRKEDFLKPYDAKKSVWVPDGEGGFDEALIDSVEGDKVHVKVGWEPKTFKSEQVMIFISISISPLMLIKVMQVNPPKMERFEDVSNMTYLNEAAVLWNLKSRYVAKLIYVSTQILKNKNG